MRLLIALLAWSAFASAGNAPLLLQKPTLSKTHVVFVYAGDLWSVPREGGNAIRLTNGVGDETDPAFSPDGNTGGFHRRVRWQRRRLRRPCRGRRPQAPHLASRARPRPRLDPRRQANHFLLVAKRLISRFAELYIVPAEGGVEEKLPLPTGDQASMSPDSQSIAYEPIGRAFTMWEKIAVAKLRASGSPASRTAPSPKFRARIRTTSIPCGPATVSTSSRTAAAPSRSGITTRSPRPSMRPFANQGLDLKIRIRRP